MSNVKKTAASANPFDDDVKASVGDDFDEVVQQEIMRAARALNQAMRDATPGSFQYLRTYYHGCDQEWTAPNPTKPAIALIEACDVLLGLLKLRVFGAPSLHDLQEMHERGALDAPDLNFLKPIVADLRERV